MVERDTSIGGFGIGAPRYRVRWARVRRGTSPCRAWMCLAEKRMEWPFGLSFWWPLDGDWRHSEPEAYRDIDHEIMLQKPPAGLGEGRVPRYQRDVPIKPSLDE